MNLSIAYLKIFFGNFDTLKCDIKWSVNVKVWLSENDKKKKKDNVGNKKKMVYLRAPFLGHYFFP